MLPPVKAPRLTEEQERVVEEALSRQHLKVIAFAGAGKTFTLQQVARALKETFPYLRILYLTFNRSLAEEARHKFQGYPEVRTNHALALAHYRHRQRWARIVPSLPQVKPFLEKHLPRMEVLQDFGYRKDDAPFLVLETLNNFLHSKDAPFQGRPGN